MQELLVLKTSRDSSLSLHRVTDLVSTPPLSFSAGSLYLLDLLGPFHSSALGTSYVQN